MTNAAPPSRRSPNKSAVARALLRAAFALTTACSCDRSRFPTSSYTRPRLTCSAGFFIRFEASLNESLELPSDEYGLIAFAEASIKLANVYQF
jgi:hypothetical protein